MAALPDTNERNRSDAERLSCLEGGYEHLATKADVERILVAVERFRAEAQIENERARAEARAENERLRTEVYTELERVRAELERNKADIIKVIIRVAGLGAALMAAGFAFLRITGAG